MEEMSKELVLTFGTDGNETVKITVSKPDTNLVAADIKAAMDAVVASGALGENGTANKALEAQYVIRQRETVDLEA